MESTPELTPAPFSSLPPAAAAMGAHHTLTVLQPQSVVSFLLALCLGAFSELQEFAQNR